METPSTTYAIRAARKIPPSTSLGKCTYRYSLENAISDAKTTAAYLNLFPENRRINAAINEESVCPDGKE